MILFVGDEPSSKNISKNIPFVGTPSYEKLVTWLPILQVDFTYAIMANKDDILQNQFNKMEITANGMTAVVDKIVALGNNASKKLEKMDLPHFKLPHPSPKNRQMNKSNKKNLDKKLNECKEWLK